MVGTPSRNRGIRGRRSVARRPYLTEGTSRNHSIRRISDCIWSGTSLVWSARMKSSPFYLFAGALLALFGSGSALAGNPLDTWYSRFTNAPAPAGFGVPTYGNSTYVVLAYSGAIAHSTNGVDWGVTNPVAQTLTGVAYGDGRFVAVGASGTVLTSSNGIDWEDHSPGTNIYLQKVCFGNDRFLALGYTITPPYNWSLVSTDGLSWASYYVASNKPTGQLAFGDGLFVYPLALGTNLLSADGISWWSQPAPLTNTLYMIGSGGNLLVAFDIRGFTFTSSDGTNWTFLGTNSLLRPHGLAYGNGFWVAVGGLPAKYSADLVQWTSVSNSQTMAPGVCFGNGTFLTASQVICQSAPVIQLQTVSGLPGAVEVFGPVGVTYEVQSLDDLTHTNWQVIADFEATTSPYLWVDPTPADAPQKFYRVWLP